MSGLDLPEFESWILEDESHLWLREWKAELCRVFRKRGKDLSRETVARICDRLLLGPPRELYRAEIAPEEWENIRKAEIYTRLSALADGQANLPAECLSSVRDARQWNVQRRRRLEELGLPVNEDGVAGISVGDGSRPDAQSLLDVPAEEVARQLCIYRDEFGSQTENWLLFAEFVRQRPERAVEVVTAILKEEDRPADLLTGFWSGLGKADENTVKGCLGEIAKLVEEVEEMLGADVASAFGTFLIAMAAADLGDEENPFRDLWDIAFERLPSLNGPEDDKRLELDRALTDLGGKLAEALVQRLAKRSLQRGSGLPEDLKLRFDRLISSDNPRAAYARIVLAQRLWWLHAIAPEWTYERLLTRMKWQTSQNESETAALWSAYLHSPRWDLDLLTTFKPDFLGTLKRCDLFDEPIFENACQLFASMSLEVQISFSKNEITLALADMGASGAKHVLGYYLYSLRDARDGAAALWRRKIGPWIDEYWPAAAEFRSPDLLSRLCEMVLLSGDAFPEALATLKNKALLGKLKSDDGIWWRLTRGDPRGRTTLLNYPREALEFLWRTIPDMPPATFAPAKTDLRKLVDEIVGEIASLSTNDQERLNQLRERLS